MVRTDRPDWVLVARTVRQFDCLTIPAGPPTRPDWRCRTVPPSVRFISPSARPPRRGGSKRVWRASKVRLTMPRLRSGPRKVSDRTIRRRINDSGGVWKPKSLNSEIAPKSVKKRVKWCKAHRRTRGQDWLRKVQAVGDFKDYTWYPPALAKKVGLSDSVWAWARRRAGPDLLSQCSLWGRP